ncbi:fungal-specific transcription factor domain-containing protein [Lipomyces tetrasporus]|uniref:Fungal-specific transcription factor domain-containing protein n=1 Tax=Lipomyces tetrasporus TaxID=54092 RepID=A0AAD7QSG6_9ASCO|nr:fungal-specific transcription factor domain-containing protein [Lipomyces tetrasporus]KAJ8100545.1 fungal-specific transcription factor domain-containing protein [Lipomyces tetrasporus]
MPDGAQAWKMIKPPGTQIGRIAQACDRCRSKKIRCDGKRPSCTQCLNVGFECRTSDKLSRRAFPRGYTESLEDHIRQLENENRQLKEHIDMRDDHMELLSRVDSLSPGANLSPGGSAALSGSRKRQHRHRSREASPARHDSSIDSDTDENDMFVLHELKNFNIDGTFEGSASGRAFAEIFQAKVGAKSVSLSSLAGNLFKTVDMSSSLPRYHFDESQSSSIPSLPPRVLADQLVNFFFNDWHPIFPVLHAPTFMTDYEKAYNASTLLGKEEFLVQLYLIFAISSRQVSIANSESHTTYERHWRRLLSTLEHRNSLTTLQSLILAQIDMCTAGQYSDMFQYKMKATGMALRLGLNRSHKQFNLNFLEGEMRLRTFWAVFTLDTFSSSLLGVPTILRDDDVECAFPSDVDDEFLTEKAILRSPPGSYTKLSAAIALSKFARVLANLLNTLYRCTPSRTRSYKVLFELEDELEEWRRDLSPHLKFEMINGNPRGPSTALHSRAPFLLLVYHYARILIHRPAIATEESKTRGSSSILTMIDSAKCIIWINNYLRSRSLSWTICMNQPKTLLSAGLIVLFGAMDYPKDGALVTDAKRIMARCLEGMYQRAGVPSTEYRVFEALCRTLVGIGTRSSAETTSAVASPSTELHSQPCKDLKIENETSESPSDSPSVDMTDFIRRPSMIIPHLPGSGQQSPPSGVAVPVAPSFPQTGQMTSDLDVLHWAISQHQQLQYRNSSSQLGAGVSAAHHDAELENLFAMMDSSNSSAGSNTTPLGPHGTVRPRSSVFDNAEINRALSVSESVVSSVSSNASTSSMTYPTRLSGTLSDLSADTNGDWNMWWGDLFSNNGSGSETANSSAPPSVNLEVDAGTACGDIPETPNSVSIPVDTVGASPKARKQTTASLLRSVKEEEWSALGWITGGGDGEKVA